jgi:hypothetical protein
VSDESKDQLAELQLVGRMADGGAIELTDGSGAKYSLPITDALKSTVTQPRLTSVAPIDERPSFSVKEVQARLRGGESMPSISRTTDWSIEKIEKFAGPILQERAYVIDTALKSNLRREASSPILSEATFVQLSNHGVDMESVDGIPIAIQMALGTSLLCIQTSTELPKRIGTLN